MSEFTEAEVIRDLAFEAARPDRLEPGKRYVFRQPDGTVREIDLSGDMPSRKAGYVTVTDVASFAAYYARHADDDSEVFADLNSAAVLAVLDAHHSVHSDFMEEGGARWQQHHLTLALRLTEPWKTWLEHDRKFMSQQAFAEFLEDNYRDLDPDGAVKAADLLEAAQQFEAVVKVEYGSGSRLQSGDVTIRRIETTEQGSGKKGYVQFPEEMDLLLKPYEDCEDTSLAARLRYRVTPDGLKLGYFLNSPERVRLDAVKQVTAKAAEAIGAAIMQGQLG
jgi:uncharacterized protein YfdQ (DUF2303 family)